MESDGYANNNGPMKYCPYCGNVVGLDYIFCPRCGKSIPTTKNNNFINKQNSVLDSKAIKQTPQKATPPKNDAVLIFFGIVGFILSIIGVVASFLFSNEARPGHWNIFFTCTLFPIGMGLIFSIIGYFNKPKRVIALIGIIISIIMILSIIITFINQLFLYMQINK